MKTFLEFLKKTDEDLLKFIKNEEIADKSNNSKKEMKCCNKCKSLRCKCKMCK
jgi:hypothetical protein